MDNSKLNILSQYLANNWALVPLHHVTGMSNGVDPVCSCRMANTCKSAGKHPRLAQWQQEANLVRTVQQLTSWPVETNWGLATGRASGVWALDVDKKGMAAFDAMVKREIVAPTRLHETGSGGWHLLYRLPPDFTPTNRTGALPEGIDVRGDGGQIVLPPSVSGTGPYTVAQLDVPVRNSLAALYGAGLIGEASAALLDLIRPAPAPARVPQDIMARIDPGGRYASYAAKAVDGELRALREAHSSRNSRAWAAAVRVIELCNATWAELDVDVEYDRWLEAGFAHPDGLVVPPSELDAVWRSALRHVAGRQADPPPDKPWPPAGDAALLDFLGGRVSASSSAAGSTTATSSTGGPLDPFARIPSGVSAGSVGRATPTGLTLPEAFWVARPVLQHIRRAAYAQAVSGDVLLYSLLARLASLWPHAVKLHTGIGTGASANLFTAVVGPSGAGKSSGVGVARDLLPLPHWLTADAYAEDWPLGTGEGIAESYMGSKRVPVDDKTSNADGSVKMHAVRTQVRHNALLHADEGEVLTRMLERAGATIGETLRRGWIGGTIGQSNGRAETTRIVKSGRYSLGLVIGFQAETAQPLLADVSAGTPQRFLWCWAIDPSTPDQPPEHPGPLTTVWRPKPADPGWVIGDPFSDVDQTPVSFAPEIVAELGREHRARLRGEEGSQLTELDAHRPLMLVKVAALLAQLSGRRQVDAEDWQLAGLVWDTSCAVRDHVGDLGRQAAGKARAADVGRHVERESAAESARLQVHQGHYDARVARVARRLAQLVAERKDIARAELRKAVAQRDRDAFDEALDMAVSNGWVARDDAHLLPGPVGV